MDVSFISSAYHFMISVSVMAMADEAFVMIYLNDVNPVA